METPITDSQVGSADRFGDIDVVSAEWARKLERDVRTLALRLIGEDENTFAPETREVMIRWNSKVLGI